MDRLRPDVAAAIAYARHRLATEIPEWLVYHGLHHTAHEVVPAARRLAEGEALDAHARDLVIVGAWFHDLGFVEQYDRNEWIAARMARDVLPGFGFAEHDVDVVAGVIEATEVPQRPTSLLQEVMCDADLFLLGTKQFPDRNQQLRAELAHSGRSFSDAEWDRNQLEFLAAHQYFTASARASNDAIKASNVELLRGRLTASGG